MSTAKILGRYRRELEEAGFSRGEAFDLVDRAAPTGVGEVTTGPDRVSIGPDPLRIVVLAGDREEAERWKDEQFRMARIDSMDRFILVSGPHGVWGLRGPLAVMKLPGFHSLPVDDRVALEDEILRANAMTSP